MITQSLIRWVEKDIFGLTSPIIQSICEEETNPKKLTTLTKGNCVNRNKKLPNCSKLMAENINSLVR